MGLDEGVSFGPFDVPNLSRTYPPPPRICSIILSLSLASTSASLIQARIPDAQVPSTSNQQHYSSLGACLPLAAKLVSILWLTSIFSILLLLMATFIWCKPFFLLLAANPPIIKRNALLCIVKTLINWVVIPWACLAARISGSSAELQSI